MTSLAQFTQSYIFNCDVSLDDYNTIFSCDFHVFFFTQFDYLNADTKQQLESLSHFIDIKQISNNCFDFSELLWCILGIFTHFILIECAFHFTMNNINNINAEHFLGHQQIFGGYWPLAVPQTISSSYLGLKLLFLNSALGSLDVLKNFISTLT